MVMAHQFEIFHGPWFVEVQSVGGAHEQQFTITQSDSSNGSCSGAPAESVMVDGEE